MSGWQQHFVDWTRCDSAQPTTRWCRPIKIQRAILRQKHAASDTPLDWELSRNNETDQWKFRKQK